MRSGMLDNVFISIDQTKREIEREALKVIAEVQDIIVEYNQDQLFQGLDAKGQKLSPKYSRVRYSRAKNSMNPLPGMGTPDLKVTGRFYSGFYLTAKNGKFSFFSSDEKAEKLEEKYGKDIFGLTQPNEEKVNFDEIYPKLLEWILNRLEI